MPLRAAAVGEVVSYRNADGETTDVVVTGAQKAAPASGDFTVTGSGTGGTLATATYSYRVTAVVNGVETPAATAKTAAVTGPTASVAIDFTVGLTSYPTASAWKVYGRTGGTELLISTINAPTATFTDTGALTPSGALPAATSAVRFRNFGTKTVQTQIPKATALTDVNAYFKR